MSDFDPFGDLKERGYLHNHAGVKEKHIVSRLEHNSFSGNIKVALESLQSAKEITLEQVQQTHKQLFGDIYPWAGQDRSQNAADLAINKGPVVFQEAPFVPHGVDYALKQAKDIPAFKDNPGKVIGELAFAHPFLDGNGRTITAVVSELTRRAGFHIAWQETNKQDYLTALTKEIDDPKGRHLTDYLKPFIRDGELDIGRASRVLTNLPGLSAPDLPEPARFTSSERDRAAASRVLETVRGDRQVGSLQSDRGSQLSDDARKLERVRQKLHDRGGHEL